MEEANQQLTTGHLNIKAGLKSLRSSLELVKISVSFTRLGRNAQDTRLGEHEIATTSYLLRSGNEILSLARELHPSGIDRLKAGVAAVIAADKTMSLASNGEYPAATVGTLEIDTNSTQIEETEPGAVAELKTKANQGAELKETGGTRTERIAKDSHAAYYERQIALKRPGGRLLDRSGMGVAKSSKRTYEELPSAQSVSDLSSDLDLDLSDSE